MDAATSRVAGGGWEDQTLARPTCQLAGEEVIMKTAVVMGIVMFLACTGAGHAGTTSGDKDVDSGKPGLINNADGLPAPTAKGGLTAEQIEFLDTLMRDTFAFIDYACDPATGIPQAYQDTADCTNSTHVGLYNYTNSTPVGLYIASIAIANQIGLLSDEEAEQRFEKVYGSMERLHQPHGFFPNFFPADLSTIPTEGTMVISDYNIYPAGLIIARQVWPQYAERISAYLDSIEWERLYDEESNQVISGYDLAEEKAAWKGLWVACDARCAVLMMIGSGAVPAKVWDGTIRGPMESKEGTILAPGNTFGVTYISAITGLFLNERDTTEVGMTVGNLAWHQYQFSRRRNYPLWGWSNCFIVGRGYTELGWIPEWNISPHALGLLIDYYPRHVTAALQKMDKLGGTVAPGCYEGKRWGLRGCYDMDRNQWGEKYLQLEQGMMFLGLANFLHDGIVRTIFESDPLIQKGLELSKPYIKHDPKLLKRWAERDARPIVETPMYRPNERVGSVDTVTALDLSELVAHQPEQLKVEHQDGTVRLSSHGAKDWTTLSLGLPAHGVDIQHLDRIEFEIDEITCDAAEPGYLRFTISDKFGQGRWSYFKLDPNNSRCSVPAREIHGFFLDDDNMAHINISMEGQPGYRMLARFNCSDFSLRIKAIRIITKEEPMPR